MKAIALLLVMFAILIAIATCTEDDGEPDPPVRGRWRFRRPVLPRAERGLGQRERGAELTRGDAMIAVDSVLRADELAGMSTRY